MPRQPLSTVELPEFRELLRLLRPSLGTHDIPNRHKMADMAMIELHRIKSHIREQFNVRIALCLFSIATHR